MITITTVKNWNDNNNKMKLLVALLISMTLLGYGYRSRAAELNGLAYTQIDQSMNVTDGRVNSEYHYVKTIAEGKVKSAYITVGSVEDTENSFSFIEAESLSGKKLFRTTINESCGWAYINSIDDANVVVTIIKDGSLYYPEIRVLNDNGEITQTYKCEYGTKEANAKLGSLIKYDDKVYFVYPVDNYLAMLEVNSSGVVSSNKIQICDANSSAYFFYDSINNKLWTCFKYYRSGRLYDYVYPIDDLSELTYSIASKKRFYRENLNTNTSFELYDKDGLLITYAKKKYLYTYSTGKSATTNYVKEEGVVWKDDDRTILSENIMNNSVQHGRKVFFVSNGGNYDIELYENNGTTIYAGANGFDIKGIIHSALDEDVEVKLVLNNNTLLYSLRTNEEFNIHLGPEQIKEGYYDDIYIEIGSNENTGVLFGEIPIGSKINYNQVFYDKVDDTLVVESYPQSNMSLSESKYNAIDKTQFLNKDEYQKYYEYISAIDNYDFWLQDGKNYNGQFVTYNKLGYGYPLYKKSINLNEKFSYNKQDGAYYNYVVSGSKKKFDHDVMVSYAPCKNPIVTVDAGNDFTNKDVAMDITFEGECSDLIAEVHVVKESLKGVEEKDVTLDFSTCNVNKYIFDESGIYQVSVIAKSAFGNKSNTVVKTFKIDKEGPLLNYVTYDNTWESPNGLLWSKSKETIAHVIFDDLSGVKNATQIDKYKYQIDVKVSSKKELNVEVNDLTGNMNNIKLENIFLVDDIEPILQKPEIEYYSSRAEITLRAFDTESGLEGIYYKIGQEDEKKYDKIITMPREKYGQHTEVIVYAKDVVDNLSEVIKLDVLLNDKPEINIEDEYINCTLDNLPSVLINTSDKDLDDVEVSVYLGEQLLAKNTNDLNFELRQIENVIREFEYNKQYKFTIVAYDGMEEVKKNFYLTKKNMKPLYKITTKGLNLANYAEINVSIYDLDEDSYGETTCIMNSNGVELGTFELQPGDNVIKLKNSCLEEEHEINFELINKNYKEKITRKVKFINLEKYDDENIFIKINDFYTNDFYNHVINLRDGIYFYTENVERYLPSDLILKTCNLRDAREYIKNRMPVIICSDLIKDDDLINLLDEEDLDSVFCYETKSSVDITPIIFLDYEGDFYSDLRGKNRKLNVKFEKLNFENTSYDFGYTIYDPFNNLTTNRTSNENVSFSKDEIKFDADNSGLYTLTISEWDEIKNGDVDYSKKSDDATVSFYAHKKPYCKLAYEELESNENTVKLRIKKDAKDEDYLSINKGILKEKICIETYSFNGELLKEEIFEDTRKEFDIVVDKNQITKIKYIVWDFGLSPEDNRFSFSAFDEIVINKINTSPFADFDYYVGNENANGYIYRMTEREDVKFKNLSDYNDLLALEGVREEKYQFELDEFNLMIDNDEELFNKLTIINKFGKTDTSISKKLEVCDIDVINISNLEEVSKGSTFLLFDVLNAKDKNEIYLMCDDEIIECVNDEYRLYLFETLNEEITLKLKVYSSRDNSYLGEKDFKVKFIQNAEVLDFKITNVYDPWVEVNLPVTIYEMPIGEIRKGYAFDFEIKTKGFNNDEDYIYVIPTYYYITDEGVIPCELVRYSHGRVYPYDLNILNNGKQIGNLNYLYLDFDDRIINNNEEIYFGKFYIPTDVRVRVNDEIYNAGHLLLNFEIIGASNSGCSFNFNKSKWISLNNSPFNPSGDTAIYCLKYDAFDDYKNYLKY